MVFIVLFLLGFVLSLFAFYTRLSLLLYLSIPLLVFSWVGDERLHKAFRLIPIAFCVIIGAVAGSRSAIYGVNYYYYDFIVAISALTSVLLFITMLPETRRHHRIKTSK